MQLSSAADPESESLASQAMTPLRILFVDDDDTIREAMAAILNWFGHKTFSAARGKDALDLYHSNTFDLVITDYQMPDMKGYELAQNIRQIDPSAKIILLTGWNNLQDEGKSAYINCILSKPATMQAVIDTIQSLFEKRT